MTSRSRSRRRPASGAPRSSHLTALRFPSSKGIRSFRGCVPSSRRRSPEVLRPGWSSTTVFIGATGDPTAGSTGPPPIQAGSCAFATPADRSNRLPRSTRRRASAAIASPTCCRAGEALIYTAAFEGISSYNDARIELWDLTTRQKKTLIEGGTSAVYSPSGHIVYARAGKVVRRGVRPAAPGSDRPSVRSPRRRDDEREHWSGALQPVRARRPGLRSRRSGRREPDPRVGGPIRESPSRFRCRRPRTSIRESRLTASRWRWRSRVPITTSTSTISPARSSAR